MTAFEATKTALWPGITLWQSHAITIAFCALLCFSLGATILRRRELRRGESERLFSSLFNSLMESLPATVVIFDNTGTIRRWNTNFLGYDPEEMVGQSIAKTAAPESLPAVQQAMKNAFELGPAEVEAVLLAKSGAKVPCILTGGRILFEGVPCILGIGIDISRRKRAEDELRLRTAALESAANATVITDTRGTTASRLSI